jgi:hypothetical protein
VRVCTHVRARGEERFSYVNWYVGTGLDAEFLCIPCAESRERGVTVEIETVCQECFKKFRRSHSLERIGGHAEVSESLISIEVELIESRIPEAVGRIVDLSPLHLGAQSIWLLLAEDGRLIHFDANTAETRDVGSTTVPSETCESPFDGHVLTRRLHTSPDGRFAAVVNDYGRYGQVIDLESGIVTLHLDGGDYCSETVPLSFAFARWQGRVIAVHRTDWNRLDISDAADGHLLTERSPTSYRQGEQRPRHYLDYFHGALYLSPDGTQIVDDGWVWHPFGVAVIWSLQSWLSENVWEAEDGATRKDLCGRDHYWDHAIAWIDAGTVAIGGIGDAWGAIIDGARIFDTTSTVCEPGYGYGLWLNAREVSAFAGPAGRFFSDGESLYSAAGDGLSRWDIKTGARTGRVPTSCPRIIIALPKS